MFVFGFIDRAIEKGKLSHWLLLGACLAWGSMRQPDLWLLFSAFSAVYLVFRLVVVLLGTPRDARRSTIVKWTKGSLVALVALLAIGGASFRSAFVNDLAGRDKQIDEGQTVASNAAKDDAEKRWIFTTNWSMPPEATKEFFCSRSEAQERNPSLHRPPWPSPRCGAGQLPPAFALCRLGDVSACACGGGGAFLSWEGRET